MCGIDFYLFSWQYDGRHDVLGVAGREFLAMHSRVVYTGGVDCLYIVGRVAPTEVVHDMESKFFRVAAEFHVLGVSVHAIVAVFDACAQTP